MPLNNGDKAIIKDIAFEAAKVIKNELVEGFKVQIKLHQASCPAKVTLGRIWFLVIGVAIGSGSGFALILKVFKVF